MSSKKAKTPGGVCRSASASRRSAKVIADQRLTGGTSDTDAVTGAANAHRPRDYLNVFNALDDNADGYLTPRRLLDVLATQGLLRTDQRLAQVMAHLEACGDDERIDPERFFEITRQNFGLVEKLARGDLIIPDFAGFRDELQAIFERCVEQRDGAVADYIPQLARVDPEQFGAAICTIDGQRWGQGDSEVPFCVQSSCKPINYCIALESLGEAAVHRHVGREPSGRSFNELALNHRNLPHNPLINAGAIMSCSLIGRRLDLADRFDSVMQTWQQLAGGWRPGYNNAVYLSEKSTADRNFALSYVMRENQAFPPDTNILETLDFYFQCCSIEMTASRMAVVASTLANGGVCPISGTRVFSNDTVKNCLSLMYSCGMYDFSGEFAFSVGLPAKSGVSGVLMVVIPQVMGLAIWSPRLDQHGNSVRGVEFCRQLVGRFAFHNYDNIAERSDRLDPRRPSEREETDLTFHLIRAASQGDVTEISRLVALGLDLGVADYDGRTALHLAACEGMGEVVDYLLSRGVDVEPVDRWGQRPADDALRHGHEEIAQRLGYAADAAKAG